MLFELSFSERPLGVSVRELKEGANISKKGPQVRDRMESALVSTAASFHVTCRADLTSNSASHALLGFTGPMAGVR